ncbi:uncharacterized protein LOC111029945 [Myzus persicae]|uniref:uncharacterized protein LOC111029945 n=1 Tax=Myzus persicae TaxID=13164 RepID=UPI000B936990|nr:uncharacterized protein LOC111029945 [Myzus persicae]
MSSSSSLYSADLDWNIWSSRNTDSTSYKLKIIEQELLSPTESSLQHLESDLNIELSQSLRTYFKQFDTDKQLFLFKNINTDFCVEKIHIIGEILEDFKKNIIVTLPRVGHFSITVIQLLQARYKYVSKKLYREFVDRTELSINANPSNFWKFIKRQAHNSDIPKTLTLNGVSSSNEQDAADMFTSYFKSVYSCEVFNDNVNDLNIQSFDLPNNAYFTVDDVFHSLSTLSGAKNVGPDGLSCVFLFQFLSIIAYPLFLLFRRSLDEAWVSSRKINYYMQLSFSNFVFESFKKRSQVDVVYTDLAKAFDTVNHKVLLRILEAFGFGEPLLSWFGSFLTNRHQWVKLFGVKSNIYSSTSGVPQGGHLSPILFLLFINSVHNALPFCQLLCFADDMKLFMEINSAADCVNLQSSFDCFVSWCFNIGLKVNASKCRVMTFTRSRSTIPFDYNISGLTIARVDNLIDLGFKLARNLSPSPHIAMITSRAFKVLGFIMRLSKDFKLSKSLKSLYCALVRPILEYGSVIWDPYTALILINSNVFNIDF